MSSGSQVDGQRGINTDRIMDDYGFIHPRSDELKYLAWNAQLGIYRCWGVFAA